MKNNSHRQRLLSNTIWTSVERYSTIAMQLLATVVIARYLSPADYGVYGLLTIILAISNTIVDSGFGMAIVREKNIVQRDYSTVFYFNIAISILMYLLICILAKPISQFYELPELQEIVMVALIVLPISALALVHTAIYTREEKFKKLCYISLVANSISSILAIGVASCLRNIWVLVIQLVSASLIRTALIWISSDYFPTFEFSISALRKYARFSKNLLISGLIGNLFNNLYAIFIGKLYAVSELGFFSQADKIKNIASHSTSSIIQSASFPLFCKIYNEGGDLRNAYKKVITVSVFLVSSMMVFLVSNACDLFDILMGQQWRPAGYYLMLLGVNGAAYPLHLINQNILMVHGDSASILRLELLRRVLMIGIILCAMKFNAYVFAASMSLYSIVLLFPNMVICGRAIQYGLWAQLVDVLPIAVKQLVVCAIALACSYFFADVNCICRVVMVSVLCFCVTALLFWQDDNVRYLKSLLLNRWQRERT